MTRKEIETAALSLPAPERVRLGEALLASVGRGTAGELASTAVEVPTSTHGITLSQPKRSIWDMDITPRDGGPADGSVNHDAYLYENPD
jgi:hypothetical protein